MIYPRPTYGAILKQAIMDNNIEFLENMVASFDKELYEEAHEACNNCDLDYLKDLIDQGVDLSHPYFCQPECFILNPLHFGYDYQETKTFLEYVITNCIDVNCIAQESFHCMHADQYSYGSNDYVQNHSSFNSVPTLFDSIELQIISGELDSFVGGFVLQLLRTNGAKSGADLGYTHEQGNRLYAFQYKDNSYNYNYMKTKKEKLHFDLIANLYHPKRINKYLETNDTIDGYLNYNLR